MSTERRTATEDVELREEGESLTAFGYASVFNKTYSPGGFVERVAPGAFRKTVAEANVVGLFNHEPDHFILFYIFKHRTISHYPILKSNYLFDTYVG